MSNIDASLVLASDIHLHEVDDFKGKTLLDTLDRVAKGKVEYFVFLGDIFDFCLGSHPYFRKRYQVIGDALERVAASGTKVVYLEGNHEFRIRDFKWKGVQFFPSGETAIQLKTGEKLKLAHGDMIYSHERYKKFRRVVKSRFVTAVARLVPGPLLNWLAISGSHVSRSADDYRKIDHNAILTAVNDWLEASDHDYGLFGHFHVPYAEKRRDGKSGGVYSVDFWGKPNFLVFKDGGFQRLKFDGEKSLWEDTKPVLDMV